MNITIAANWAPVIGILGILFAVHTYFSLKKVSGGTERMMEISETVHSGAMTFLRREYTYITIFVALVFLALSSFISLWTGVAFLGGAACSMLAGLFGMEAATRSANRTCQGAISGGTPEALFIAFKGGSVMGISVAALGVLGIGAAYYFTKNPMIINGFAMGASSIALFARVGGGIYTKAADVGADIVGKTEASIPEDDPRNPGVIADNVGDNVGDTAGMGADLFESYVGSVIATMAIGFTFVDERVARMALPLVLISVGLVSSVIGVFSMNIFKKINPQSALRYATYVSGIIFIVSAYICVRAVLGATAVFWAVLAGMFVGVLIGAESEFYTSGPPIKKLALSSRSGPATTIISGIALGFLSCVLPVITLAVGISVAYHFAGLYGIAISAVGMLATIGIVMSTDSYGPIADNAGGVAEMSHAGPEIRKITDRLDSLGNTTAAIGKGFAIGSAALTALALFSAFQKTVNLPVINLVSVKTIVGLFLGALMPFLMAALTMNAVGRAADGMITEIRRQFREIKGLMEGTAKADSDACIDIVTRGALREMIIPGLSAVIAPILVGKFLGLEALGGFLAGATVTGVLLGIMMANAGAAWDNAKKWIEAGNLGGKGSDTHKAAVIGDTVGDPFKDTSGPSMNILIKLMAIVSLVFAPVLM